jgi:serralysin
MDDEDRNHFCADVGGKVAYDVDLHPEFGALQAVALHSKMWPQFAEIRISFIGGTQYQRRLVRNVTMQNYGPLVNLKLQFVDSGGDMRVSFAEGEGSWSALGTDALLVDAKKPTMNLGWLDDPPKASNDSDCCYAVIKHEMGHALGAFLHEHQNPEVPFEWDEKNVYRDLSGAPNHWDEAAVQTNMFERYSHPEIRGTEYDSDSIMHYFFPMSWTKQRLRVKTNQNLSAQDKYFLQITYPQITNLPIHLQDRTKPERQLYEKLQHRDELKKSGIEPPSDRRLAWLALCAIVLMSCLSYLLGSSRQASKKYKSPFR